MATVLTFRYPECGFEVNVTMMPGQRKTELSKRLGPIVSRRHRRQCETCRQRRKERYRDDSPHFSTRQGDTSGLSAPASDETPPDRAAP